MSKFSVDPTSLTAEAARLRTAALALGDPASPPVVPHPGVDAAAVAAHNSATFEVRLHRQVILTLSDMLAASAQRYAGAEAAAAVPPGM